METTHGPRSRWVDVVTVQWGACVYVCSPDARTVFRDRGRRKQRGCLGERLRAKAIGDWSSVADVANGSDGPEPDYDALLEEFDALRMRRTLKSRESQTRVDPDAADAPAS